MKTFVKKSFVVFLFAVSFAFLVGDLINVGDKYYDVTNNQEASKNYNGYLSLKDEDSILLMSENNLECGYYKNHTYGYICDSEIVVTQEFQTYEFHDVLFYEDWNGFIRKAFFVQITFYTQGTDKKMTIYILHNQGEEYITFTNYATIAIYGTSNYEVES